jgi:hypothetical protein
MSKDVELACKIAQKRILQNKSLIENMVKKNRSGFPIAVLLTTVFARVPPSAQS